MATIVFSGGANATSAGNALDTVGTTLNAQSAFQFSEAAWQRFFNDTSYEVPGTPTSTLLAVRYADGDTVNVGGTDLLGSAVTYTTFEYVRALGGTATVTGAIGFDQEWNRTGSVSQRVVEFGGATITIASGPAGAGGTPVSAITWSRDGVTLTITGSLTASGGDPNATVDAFLGAHGTTLSGSITGYTLSFAAGTVTATGLDIAFGQFATSFAAPDGLENLLLAGATPPPADETPPAGAITGTEGNDRLEGTSGNDTVLGLGGNDTIEAGAGNDSLEGGTGADVLRGGTGDDTYRVEDPADAVVESRSQAAGGGVDTILATLSWRLGAHVENLELLGSADLDAEGNWLANRITGNAGANRLDGRGGVDTLVGGAGDDTYVVGALDVIVEDVNGAGGVDTVESWLSIDLTLARFDGVENATITGGGFRKLVGDDGANVLRGGSGANFIDGGAGGDVMEGGAGNDTYVVSDVSDDVVELAGGGIDTVRTSLSSLVLGENLEKLVLLEGALAGTGNGLANRITGNTSANLLDGGAGNDLLAGGAGDDTYVVDSTADRVIEGVDGGIDTIRATVSLALGAHVENLELLPGAIAGTGNALANRITGNDAANLLSGRSGNDSLAGGAGADTLVGGHGADTLTGGSDGDVFVFAVHARGGNADLVTDFDAAEDVLHLENAVFTRIGGAGVLDAGKFATVSGSYAGAAPESDDRLVYNTDTGVLFYDANGSQAGGHTLVAILQNGGSAAALSAADIVVI